MAAGSHERPRRSQCCRRAGQRSKTTWYGMRRGRRSLRLDEQLVHLSEVARRQFCTLQRRTLRAVASCSWWHDRIRHRPARSASPRQAGAPNSIDEVQRILEAAMQRPNGSRWAIALALGLRQGEVAGLRWADVDLETRSLRIQGMRPRPVPIPSFFHLLSLPLWARMRREVRT